MDFPACMSSLACGPFFIFLREVHLPKTRKEKQAELREMSEDLRQSQVVILTEYRGLSVSDISRIRGQLRDKGTKFSVAKNTLMALALKENGQVVPEDLLTGPTAFAFVRDDHAAFTVGSDVFVQRRFDVRDFVG